MRESYAKRYRDIIGAKYGNLTVLSLTDELDNCGRIMCRCKCDCGRECLLAAARVINGHNKSCGKCNYIGKLCAEMFTKDVTGKRFGLLTAVRPTSGRRHGQIVWVFRCDCGREVTHPLHDVDGSHGKGIKSCGQCGYKSRRIAETKTIYKTPAELRASRIYAAMKRRCYKPNSKDYHNYGGRGIRISEEWLSDRKKFVDWAVTHGVDDLNLSIDRIDNNGPYSAENCRFVDDRTQCNNTRFNRRLTVDGYTDTARNWERACGLKIGTLSTLSDSDAVTKLNELVSDGFVDISERGNFRY